MKNTQTLKRIIASVLIILLLLVIVFVGDVLANKYINASYAACPSVDKDMFRALSDYIASNSTCDATNSLPQTDAQGVDDALPAQCLSFDMPVLFVYRNSIRGSAYLFNHPITEHTVALGLNGGVYAAELLLPLELNLVGPYRMALLTPMLSSLIFSPENTTVDICGIQTAVISYDEPSLTDGSFIQALDALFSAASA